MTCSKCGPTTVDLGGLCIRCGRPANRPGDRLIKAVVRILPVSWLMWLWRRLRR